MKIPAADYEPTGAFYRDTLGRHPRRPMTPATRRVVHLLATASPSSDQ